MDIILGSLALPAGLVWEDRNSYTMVGQEVLRTLGGKPVVYFGSYTDARPITLKSLEDQGWLTLAQVEALQVMADTPGASFALSIEGKTFNVIFRHNEPPAFTASSLVPRGTLLERDMFIGTIKLLTI